MQAAGAGAPDRGLRVARLRQERTRLPVAQHDPGESHSDETVDPRPVPGQPAARGERADLGAVLGPVAAGRVRRGGRGGAKGPPAGFLLYPGVAVGHLAAGHVRRHAADRVAKRLGDRKSVV
jgi:hypothetical protein